MRKTKTHCPAISVVMTVYNGEKYIEEAMHSMLAQTFKNFEFIIIDDGSNDKSLSLIKEFSRKDTRISYISRENKGSIYSLNQALDKSKGCYIAKMDADDVSYPQRLSKQYSFMEANDLDICGGDFISINREGLFQDSYEVPKSDVEILLTMASNVPFAHPSVMIRKNFLSKHNLKYGMNGNRFADDIDLWMNMYNVGAKFGNLDCNILKYRVHPGSFSAINARIMRKETNKQFDIFVSTNRDNFKDALELFCANNGKEDQQRMAIKALMRYLYVDFDVKLLCQYAVKVKLVSLISGILSHIKSRLVI